MTDEPHIGILEFGATSALERFSAQRALFKLEVTWKCTRGSPTGTADTLLQRSLDVPALLDLVVSEVLNRKEHQPKATAPMLLPIRTPWQKHDILSRSSLAPDSEKKQVVYASGSLRMCRISDRVAKVWLNGWQQVSKPPEESTS